MSASAFLTPHNQQVDAEVSHSSPQIFSQMRVSQKDLKCKMQKHTTACLKSVLVIANKRYFTRPLSHQTQAHGFKD
jgi:hypothetical protein